MILFPLRSPLRWGGYPPDPISSLRTSTAARKTKRPHREESRPDCQAPGAGKKSGVDESPSRQGGDGVGPGLDLAFDGVVLVGRDPDGPPGEGDVVVVTGPWHLSRA